VASRHFAVLRNLVAIGA